MFLLHLSVLSRRVVGARRVLGRARQPFPSHCQGGNFKPDGFHDYICAVGVGHTQTCKWCFGDLWDLWRTKTLQAVTECVTIQVPDFIHILNKRNLVIKSNGGQWPNERREQTWASVTLILFPAPSALSFLFWHFECMLNWLWVGPIAYNGCWSDKKAELPSNSRVQLLSAVSA